MNNLQLIRRLSSQDALLLIKERGLSDSHEILELLSPAQVQNILDLDGWSHDRVHLQKMESWLKALYEASPTKATQAFHALDIELMAFLLKSHTRIYHIEIGEEPLEHYDQGLHTPNNRFLITFSGSPIWKALLEQLLSRDLSKTLGLIEAIRYETESELEEAALRWRDGRMQDLGFAPFEESKAILAYLNPNTPLLKANDISFEEPLMGEGILKLVNRQGVFQKTFEKLNEHDQTRVLQELVSTCNRVHVAFEREPGDLTSLKETVTYVVLMVEKALEYRSPDLLKTAALAKLFQIGRSV